MAACRIGGGPRASSAAGPGGSDWGRGCASGKRRLGFALRTGKGNAMVVWQGLWAGLVATVAMDLWLVALHLLFGRPAPAWAIPGRWFAEVARGRIWHDDMNVVPPVAGEAALGWAGHYAVGLVYGIVLVAICGAGWAAAPTVWPALVMGWVTILAGWFLMAPGMGNGWAGSKSRTAWTDRIMGLIVHTVFGFGLYLGALMLVPMGLA
jgi:hypothetical protein